MRLLHPSSEPPVRNYATAGGWIEGVLGGSTEGVFVAREVGLTFSWVPDPTATEPEVWYRVFPWSNVEWARVEFVSDLGLTLHTHERITADADRIIRGSLTHEVSGDPGSESYLLVPSDEFPLLTWLSWITRGGVRILQPRQI